MKYENPVIQGDYSDPDVIRVGDGFYMVASSWHFSPSVPVLYSENLVEWKLVNHVLKDMPFPRFNEVRQGDEGAMAPSIRYHNGKFYCLLCFPDDGIYVSESVEPAKEWSPLRLLSESDDFQSPCPVWHNGKCYIFLSFSKNRAEHSQIAVMEADEELTQVSGGYTVVFDGKNVAPLIEKPKVYRMGNYFYVFAPAGGGRSGWQVLLRSENIYGPYESKVVLMQSITDVNGPNGGSLVEADGGWAFLHSQYRGAYGCAVHLQPAALKNGWFLLGEAFEDNLSGVPVSGGDYPVNVATDFSLDPSDEFDGESLSEKWQNPANRVDGWFEMKKGLRLNCVYYGKNALADMPQLFLQNVPYQNFSVKTKCRLNLINDGDEVGFCVYGIEYAYVCVVRRGGQNFLEIRKGNIGVANDETLCQSQPYDEKYVTFQMSAKYEDRHKLTYKFTFGGSAFTHKFYGKGGIWAGARIGIYARSDTAGKGSGTFRFFRVVRTDNRVKT